jgi:hypothetical protein
MYIYDIKIKVYVNIVIENKHKIFYLFKFIKYFILYLIKLIIGNIKYMLSLCYIIIKTFYIIM